MSKPTAHPVQAHPVQAHPVQAHAVLATAMDEIPFLFNIRKPYFMWLNYHLIPILVPWIVFTLSFCQAPLGFIVGLVYLAFLIGGCILRYFILRYMGSDEKSWEKKRGTPCEPFVYGPHSSTYSFFITTFSFFYVCCPMFINKYINWSVFSLLLFFWVFDFVAKFPHQCVDNWSIGVGEILVSALFAFALVSAMMAGGPSSQEKLFFGVEDASQCKVSKQTFKCALRNGSLTSS